MIIELKIKDIFSPISILEGPEELKEIQNTRTKILLQVNKEMVERITSLGGVITSTNLEIEGYISYVISIKNGALIPFVSGA